MKTQRRNHAVEKSTAKHFILGVVAVLGLFAATIDGTIAGADDTGTCGEFNFGFSGTNLINDGISNSAGPFPITLPGGTYDVTLMGEDSHTTGQPSEQPGEQWYVALDNGWQSELTDDIPDDEDTITTVFRGVTIDAATAISVHHAGEGNVNSLRVICVGFTPTGAGGNAAPEGDNCSIIEAPAEDAVVEDAPAEAPAEDTVVEDAPAEAPAEDTVEDNAGSSPLQIEDEPGTTAEVPVEDAATEDAAAEDDGCDPAEDEVIEDRSDAVTEDAVIEDEEAPVEAAAEDG